MIKKHHRFIAGMLTAGMFFSSAAFVSAETTTPDVAALTAQVQTLLAQVAALQTQLTATQTEMASVKQELALTRSLAFGAKGVDVSDLQAFLKTMPDVYPEGLVTGFFGHATEKAIKRLQGKHGIEQAGIVGPRTREKLRSLFSEHEGHGKHGENKGNLSRGHKDDNDDDEDEDEDHHFASSTAGVGKVIVCHKPEHGNHGETLSIATSALWAHIKHGDTMGTCGGTGTTPDTTAPVISNIVAQSTTVAATIAFDTNESASYKLWYGTTSPIVSGTPNQTGGMSLHQTISLTGLLSGTTYFYIIAATDASGNTSTSTQQSFVTATPDTTAPVISGISASAITASSATILWTTNENADSTVWYSLVNPLDVASTTATTKLFNAALGLSHSVALPGLTASSTYYYLVGSKDASGNQATSSQASFVTL